MTTVYKSALILFGMELGCPKARPDITVMVDWA